MKLWRGQPENWTWTPSHGDKGRLWVGLAGVFYLAAIVALASPSIFRASGRWGWLHSLSTKAFGPSGDIVLYAIIGSACLVTGLLYFRAAR
jgi:hypothetical protein